MYYLTYLKYKLLLQDISIVEVVIKSCQNVYFRLELKIIIVQIKIVDNCDIYL